MEYNNTYTNIIYGIVKKKRFEHTNINNNNDNNIIKKTFSPPVTDRCDTARNCGARACNADY